MKNERVRAGPLLFWGGRGVGWAIFFNSCQAKPRGKRIMQGEPWGKNQASSRYYPGPVFDTPSDTWTTYSPTKTSCTTKTFHASKKFPPCSSCPNNGLNHTKHIDVCCAAILNCYWLPRSSSFSHTVIALRWQYDNNTEVHNEQFLEISLSQPISYDLG